MSVSTMSAQLDALSAMIVQPLNPALDKSAKIHVLPLMPVDRMLSVLWWNSELNALVKLDSFPIQVQRWAVSGSRHHALPTNSVLKASSVQPPSADHSAIVMLLVMPTSSALTMSVKRFVDPTESVEAMRFAKESNVSKDAGKTVIVIHLRLATTINALTLVRSHCAVSMPTASLKTTRPFALAHLDSLGIPVNDVRCQPSPVPTTSSVDVAPSVQMVSVLPSVRHQTVIACPTKSARRVSARGSAAATINVEPTECASTGCALRVATQVVIVHLARCA